MSKTEDRTVNKLVRIGTGNYVDPTEIVEIRVYENDKFSNDDRQYDLGESGTFEITYRSGKTSKYHAKTLVTCDRWFKRIQSYRK